MVVDGALVKDYGTLKYQNYQDLKSPLLEPILKPTFRALPLPLSLSYSRTLSYAKFSFPRLSQFFSLSFSVMSTNSVSLL